MIRQFLFASLTVSVSSAAALAQCPIQVIDESVDAIDVDGDFAVLGVPNESSLFAIGGAVRVFEDNGSTWNLVQTLSPAALTEGDRFGVDVAIDGDWILASTGTGEPDITSFFHRTAAGWVETQSVSLLGSGGNPVAVRGEWAAVGGVDSSGDAIVEIYSLQGTTWVLAQTVTPHLPDYEPTALEFAQGTLWVGTYGAVFLFDLVQGQWEQTTRLSGSETNQPCCSQFGQVLDSDGMTVVVGSRLDQSLSGSAYAFEKVGGQWVETARLSQSEGNQFFVGHSVSVNGDLIAVGATDRLELWRRTASGWAFDESIYTATVENGYAIDVALTSDNGRAFVSTSPPKAYVVDLTVGETPFTYCPSTINSSFERGQMLFNGGTSLAANAAVIGARWAGGDSTGLFFYGDETRLVPFGAGFRCVGGQLTRLMPPVITSMSGYVSLPLDFTAPPFDSGPGQITPGSTWRFQFWFRDPMGMSPSTFNTTNALEVTFCP